MKNIICKILFIFLAASFIFANAAKAEPFAVTSLGPVQGVNQRGVEVFKGIPYAKSPSGTLRFAPPEPVENFPDTYMATTFCPIPVQPGFVSHDPMKNAAEDCLCLNIFRPKGAKDGDKLPVYVWIYGGAFVSGASSISTYDGTSFAKNGIILITFNYRINALGFYSSEETLKQYGTTGNWGILDMIEALKWVHTHIEDFGGDRDNITIGGESAGAYAASALVLSDKAQGLFNKVILESGTIFNYPIDGFNAELNNTEALKASERFASFFEAKDNAQGLEKLRQIDPVLIAMQSNFEYDMINNTQHILKPYFDGTTLPSDPLKTLKDGDYKKVSVLIGYNTNEGTMFTNPNITDSQFRLSLTRLFGQEKGDEVYEYFSKKKGSDYKKASDFMGDMMFNLGMKLFADELSKKANVYMYHFAYGPDDVDRSGGVSHCRELRYAFNNLKEHASEKDYEVAQKMHERFVNFIKFSDPNIHEEAGNKVNNYLIKWPVYETDSPYVMRIDSFMRPEKFELKDELLFLTPYFISK